MKKIAVLLSVAVLFASCGQSKRSDVQRKVDDYKTVEIKTPDLSYISDNGKEVLNLYKFAADEADKIYWKQYFGDKSLMDNLEDPAAREYAMINYGPWDRINGEPFVEGYGKRPRGAGFYPADMTGAEFVSFDDPAKLSPYTIVRRKGNGALETAWFHEEYAANIEKIVSYLNAAADLTIVPSVREYLLKKAEGLKTDNYFESSAAWLNMTDSKMDLVLGPEETSDDQLLGLKRSYSAYVLLKDLKKTEELAKYVGMIPELQASLPVDKAYKTGFKPGDESSIYAYDEIYCGGQANAGVKLIALNLPVDEEVAEKIGTRTAILSNVLEAKFNAIIYPSAIVLLNSDLIENINSDAFFWEIAFREVAHGLGIKETINGKGSVEEALGDKALTWEEMKGNVLGTWLACRLADEHDFAEIVTRDNIIATFIVNLIRSERFGEGEALGRANIMIYNYLAEAEAFSRQASGKYLIDFNKAFKAIEKFAGLILKVQGDGDYSAARAFEEKYEKVPEAYKADLTNLRLEGIPTDIRLKFEK